MVSDNPENGEVDIADMGVPPLPEEHEDQFLDSEGLFLPEKFARHAHEVSGIVGPIGVVLQILEDVENDLDVISPEDDLEYCQQLIQSSITILTEAADQRISDYDSRLYDKSDLESSTVIDQDKNQAEESIRYDDFANVTIDKVNGKGNLLTRPDDLAYDHLHLSHGQVGEEVIIYLGPDIAGHAEGLQHPVLPFETSDEAAENYSKDTTLYIKEGDLVKFTDPEPIEQESPAIAVDGYNIGKVEMNEEVPEKKEITVRIEKIDDCSAEGRIEKSTTKQQYREDTSKSKGRRKKSSRFAGRGNNDNPFGETGKNRNDLIRDNLR